MKLVRETPYRSIGRYGKGLGYNEVTTFEKSMRARPFSIHIPEPTLFDLKARLAQTRWPDAIADAAWTYGASVEYMKEIVDYWQTQFDWRAQENAINQFSQFSAEIEGLNLHFIHERRYETQAAMT